MRGGWPGRVIGYSAAAWSGPGLVDSQEEMMESQEVPTMARPRRQFSKEFKLETVKLVKEGPRSISQVARDLDLTESALRNWVRQCDIDTGTQPGTTTAERQELQRLRAEVRQLRLERDVLKKATAFFAKESL